MSHFMCVDRSNCWIWRTAICFAKLEENEFYSQQCKVLLYFRTNWFLFNL